MDELDDLGPLPESDDNSVLQAESFKALENALPTDRFVLREEPQPDAGVDRSIELRIGGRYTGMRAHVQVKARAETKANSDGSVSYSADVSNINYLLNGASPLYVVYLADRRELRYAWVRDEVSRIRGENLGWMGQKTVTLRFTAVLAEAGLRDIHGRIRQDARLDRQIHDILSRAEVTEKTIHVNLKKSKVTDPEEVRDLLLRVGMTLVSEQEAGAVLASIHMLRPPDRRLARILLIQAFAEYSLGRYLSASACMAELTVRAAELADADREFLGVLRAACEYREGRIPTQEYIDRQRAASERAEGVFGLTLRVEYLWHELLEEQSNKDVSEDRLARMRSAVDQILGMEDASTTAKLRARIAWLHCDGMRVVNAYNYGFGIVEMRALVGGPHEIQNTMEPLKLRLQSWVEDANQLVEDALRLGNENILADAVWARSMILFAHISFMEMKLTPDGISSNRRLITDHILPGLEQAIRCYEAGDHLESGLRTKVLLADYFHLMDEKDRALDLAKLVHPIALAYRYTKIAADAERHLSGVPFFRILQEQYRSFRAQPWEFRLADQTEEGIRKSARDLMETLRLPSSQLAGMIQEVTSWRDVARERLSWCRHIDIVDGPRDVNDLGMVFRADVVKTCVCEKHGHLSRNGTADWRTDVKEFKAYFCESCPNRDPKHR